MILDQWLWSTLQRKHENQINLQKTHALLTSASILVVGSNSSTVVDEGTVVQQKGWWTLDIDNIDLGNIVIDITLLI